MTRSSERQGTPSAADGAPTAGNRVQDERRAGSAVDSRRSSAALRGPRPRADTYAGFVLAGDRLPKDAQVSGVAVGGLDRSQAIEKLTAELGARAAEPIEVTAPEKTGQLTPADAGLTIDYAKSVDAAGGGKSLEPAQYSRCWSEARSTDAVVVVDQDKLEAPCRSWQDHRPSAGRRGVAYKGTKVKRSTAAKERSVRPSAAAATITSSFLTAQAPIECRPISANRRSATTKPFGWSRASPSRPSRGRSRSVRGRGGLVQIGPKMLAGSISFPPQDGNAGARSGRKEATVQR